MTQDLENFLAASAPAAAQPQPAAAPTQPAAPAPAAPESVLQMLRADMPGVDKQLQRQILAKQFTLPADLAPAPAPAPAAPAPPPAPAAQQPPGMDPNLVRAAYDAQAGGQPAAPAVEPQPTPLAALPETGHPPAPLKGVQKADRLKLACAALSGGLISLDAAQRYYIGGRGGE